MPLPTAGAARVDPHPVVPRRLGWLLFALAWLVAPWIFRDGLGLSLLSQIGIATIVCLSYNILLGQGGMLSFGHALFSGFGAFLAMHTLQQVAGGWPVPWDQTR